MREDKCHGILSLTRSQRIMLRCWNVEVVSQRLGPLCSGPSTGRDQRPCVTRCPAGGGSQSRAIASMPCYGWILSPEWPPSASSADTRRRLRWDKLTSARRDPKRTVIKTTDLAVSPMDTISSSIPHQASGMRLGPCRRFALHMKYNL